MAWGAHGRAPNCADCRGIPCPLRRIHIDLLYAGGCSVEELALNDGRWGPKRIAQAKALIAEHGESPERIPDNG